jgi:hypothetical protein
MGLDVPGNKTEAIPGHQQYKEQDRQTNPKRKRFYHACFASTAIFVQKKQ